jgi:hypothetical protein
VPLVILYWSTTAPQQTNFIFVANCEQQNGIFLIVVFSGVDSFAVYPSVARGSLPTDHTGGWLRVQSEHAKRADYAASGLTLVIRGRWKRVIWSVWRVICALPRGHIKYCRPSARLLSKYLLDIDA